MKDTVHTDEFATTAAHLLRALRDPGEFHTFKAHIAHTLDDDQKGAIAWAALMACPTSVIDAVIEELARPAALDIQPVFNTADDWKDAAEKWAMYASQGELRAFAGAAVRAMTPENRAALREWINGEIKQ